MSIFSGVDLTDMLKHHDRTEEEAGGVCSVLSCHVGGGTVDGFEHGVVGADVGGAGEADRAGDLGCDVTYDVAVEVFGDNDVESFWNIGEFGGTDVDDVVVFFDVRIFGTDFVEDRVEKTVGHFHDIVFCEAGDFFAVIEFGILKGVTDDAFAARAGNEFEALNDVGCLLVFNACVEVFFIFADDDDVHAGLFGFNKGGVGDGGADVGVEA